MTRSDLLHGRALALLGAAAVILLALGDAQARAATATVMYDESANTRIVIPPGVTSMNFVAVGGSGGAAPSVGARGGSGAQVTADLDVSPGEVYYVCVASNGVSGDGPLGGGGGGGGATDLRTALCRGPLEPDPRMLVAGGGGGHGSGTFGGAGGDAGAAGISAASGVTSATGGQAGVPAGTGQGGAGGGSGLFATPKDGGNGTRGLGGDGAWGPHVYGGSNGGGSGGTSDGGSIGILFAGGGGGGGLNGGGGGGGSSGTSGASAGAGGGGGSSLVPAGGSATLDLTRIPSLTLRFEDITPPVVGLNQPPEVAAGAPAFLTGRGGSALDDDHWVTIRVYSGASATGAPVYTVAAATDPENNSPGYFARVDVDLASGLYTVQTSQSDAAGFTATSPARSFTVDRTAPSLSLTEPADGASIGPAGATFMGVAGIAPRDERTVTVKVYNGPTTSGAPVYTLAGRSDAATGAYSIPSPDLADGTYTAVASQADTLRNASATPARTFTVDTVAPDPALTAPAERARTNDTTPTFSGSGSTAARDGDDVTVEVYPSGSVTGEPAARLVTARDAGSGAFTVEPRTPLAEGTYTARVRQLDAAGNAATSATRSFTVDTTAPTVTLTGPANGTSGVAATPTVSGTAATGTGDVPSVLIRLYVGATPGGTVVQTITAARDAAGSYSAPALFALAKGRYTAQASQGDDAGNTGTSPAATFTVGRLAKTAPAITRASLTRRTFHIGSGRRAGTKIRFTLDRKATVKITINRAKRSRPLGTLTRKAKAGANRIAFSGRIGRKHLAPGRYVMTIVAVDATGGRSAAKRLSFRIR